MAESLIVDSHWQISAADKLHLSKTTARAWTMTWDEIKDLVEKNGNVKTVTMEILRDAHGAGRLGSVVREEIKRHLAGMGLGHVPVVLPSYQQENVRLYKRGTPVGELIEDVLTPSEQRDVALSERFGDAQVDYAGILSAIRELVAE